MRWQSNEPMIQWDKKKITQWAMWQEDNKTTRQWYNETRRQQNNKTMIQWDKKTTKQDNATMRQ